MILDIMGGLVIRMGLSALDNGLDVWIFAHCDLFDSPTLMDLCWILTNDQTEAGYKIA